MTEGGKPPVGLDLRAAVRMRENIEMDEKDGNVRGFVTIEYRDPTTGKVREKIEDENHVFGNSFKCGFWSNMLIQTARDIFFVTDDNTPPSDDLPYLRGNIIGWGRNVVGGTNVRQGAFVAGESQPMGADIGEGLGRRFRYVFDFTPTQLLEGIGSFGFTPQYRPFVHQVASTTEHCFLRPIRERFLNQWNTLPATTVNIANVFKKGTSYRLHQSAATAAGIVTLQIQDLLRTGVSSIRPNIVVTPHFTALGAGQERSVGIAFDSDRAYLMMLSATVVQRRLFEFEDDTFTNLLNTYLLPTVAAQGTLRVFAVYGKTIYAYHPTTGQMMYVEDFTNPENWIIVEANACPYNTALGVGMRSITINDGILSSHGFARQPWFDIETKKQVLNTFAIGGTTQNTLGTCLDPSQGNRMFLHTIPGTFGTAVYDYVTTQALCCYAMPPDAPPRPEGTGVRISYQLDVMF